MLRCATERKTKMINPNDAYSVLTAAIMKRHTCNETTAIHRLESVLFNIKDGEDSYLSGAMRLGLEVHHLPSCELDAADLLACIE